MAQTGNNPYERLPIPDLGGMMKRLSEFLYSAVKGNISSGGNPKWIERQRSPWKPMGHPPLMGTGNLFNSLTPSFSEEQGWARVDTSRGDAKTQLIARVHNWGADLKIPITKKSISYFLWMYHKTGDPAWKKMWFLGAKRGHTEFVKVRGIPQRRFLWLSPEDIKKAKKIVGGLPLTITDGKSTIYA